jgi:hypothetical protein
MHRLVRAELGKALRELVARPARVPPLEVEQAGGDLDEALVERPLLVGRRAPQRLPRLVGMPVADPVEEGDAASEEPIDLPWIEGRRPAGGQLAGLSGIGARCAAGSRGVRGHRPRS